MIGDRNAQLLKRSTDVKNNPSLRAAFEASGLDYNTPYHWRVLLCLLADYFADDAKGKGGRPKEDDLQFLQDYAAFKKKHPKSGDKNIFRFMAKPGECQGRYSGAKEDTLKKKLQRAIEGFLNVSIPRGLPKLQAESERDGKRWSEIEARKRIRVAVKNGLLEGLHKAAFRRDKTSPK
jgi:hypothetical protein